MIFIAGFNHFIGSMLREQAATAMILGKNSLFVRRYVKKFCATDMSASDMSVVLRQKINPSSWFGEYFNLAISETFGKAIKNQIDKWGAKSLGFRQNSRGATWRRCCNQPPALPPAWQ